MSIKGNDIILSVYDTAGSAYRPVACLTTNALNETREIITSPVTKCDPDNVSKTKGAKDYNLTFDGQYIDTTSVGGDSAKASHDFLRSIGDSQETITWRMATGLADTPFYYGNAILTDLTLTSPVNQDATFTGTLDGSGAIVEVDPQA